MRIINPVETFDIGPAIIEANEKIAAKSHNIAGKSLEKITSSNVRYDQTDRNMRSMIGEAIYPEKFFSAKEIKDKKVLDVGTGRGSFVLDLNKLGAKAIGIDIQPAANFYKYPDLFKVADATNTNFPANTFDTIYSSCSIFFYREPFDFKVKALNELKRIAKVGGKIRIGASLTKEMKEIAKSVSGLKITDSSDKNYLFRTLFLGKPKGNWIEFTKIADEKKL